MIRFQSGDELPAWCELRHFEILNMTKDESLERAPRANRVRVLMTRGRAQIRWAGQSVVVRGGQFWDAPKGVTDWQIMGCTDDAEAIELRGHWGDEIAGCGIWEIENTDNPQDNGDPVTYEKQTRMDSHYHDYDEYWFVLAGHARAVVGSDMVDVHPGDCVIIRTGHHHDLPFVHEKMRGAFFETTLVGQKRLGHLWEHTHGKAVPLAR